MSILRSILSFFLSPLRRFFPAAPVYEPLRDEETDENSGEMTADRTRTTESREPPDSASQVRRRTPRAGHDSNSKSTSNRRQSRILTWIGGKRSHGEDGKSRRQTPKQTPEPHVIRDDQSKRLFQDTLDICSETDVIKACLAINEKIDNATLTLVDEWSEAPSISRTLCNSNASGLDSNAENYLLSVVGSSLCNLVKGARSSPPSSEVQNWVTDALQSLAVYYVRYIVSRTFCPGLSPQSDADFKEIFESMLRSEPLPATALRWRALTYTYSTSKQRSENVNNYAANVVKYLAHCFQLIFHLAGEKDSSPLVSRIQKVIAESEIVESAITLSEMIKTKFFSVHLDVYDVSTGEEFREDTMQTEVDKKSNAFRTRPVLCTLEIGLREVPCRTGHGRCLLKPKVALMPEVSQSHSD